MSIESREDFEGLTRIGRIVAEVLRTLREAVRPGITTAELDAIAARELAARGAQSSPALVYGFPGLAASASMRKWYTASPAAVPFALATS
jgi:methionyl aminopeptidase